MKIFTAQSDLPWHRERRPAGFTLIEVMFASALLIVVIMALLSAHLIGLRLDQLVESKAGASESSRRALNQLPMDIRSAKMWNIGNISGTNFVNLVDGQSQQGTALALFESTNGSQYILYYFDTSDVANSNGKLMRTVSTNWNPVVLASNLITSLYFREEDYNGNVSTLDGSRSYKYIIHTTLQFCQFQFPLTPVGTNGLYDYFKLEFKATPHLPE
jgi:Tfp pilus assembly protein PilW